MKNIILVSIATAALATSASGQSLLLNPGQSYVFSFDASSLPRPVASPFGNVIFGSYGLVANGGGNIGCHWLVEMFENNLSEAPIFVFQQDRSEDCSQQPIVGGAWQDLQGVVRVTALGQTLVSPMEVEINVPSANGPLYYNGYIQPVPEPNAVALLAVGSAVGLFFYGRRRNRIPSAMRCSEPGPRVQVSIHASRGPGR